MRLICYLCFFVLFNPIYANLVINEVMIDPEGSDTGKEWIELYNSSNETINLEGWKIQSAGTSFSTNYTLPDYKLMPYSFLLIGESEVEDCNLCTTLDFQNGGSASDGIRIINPSSDYTDTIIYDSPNTNSLPDDISNPALTFINESIASKTIARKTDGVDTNQISDWSVSSIPTPGFSNTDYIDIEISCIYILVTENHVRINTLIHNLSTIPVDLNASWINYVIDSLSSNLDPIIAFDSSGNSFLSTEISDLSTNLHKVTVNVFTPNDVNTVNNSKSSYFVIGDSPIIINEIMHSPLSDNPEWIEIFNTSDNNIAMSSSYIIDASLGDINFSATLLPLHYYVLTNNSQKLITNYPQIDTSCIIKCSSWTSLNNTGDILKLYYDSSLLLDSVSYTNHTTSNGISLERHCSNDSVYWSANTSVNGASPGLPNNLLESESDLFIEKANIQKSESKLKHYLKINSINLNRPASFTLKLYQKIDNNSYTLISEEDFSLISSIEIIKETDYFSNVYNIFCYEIASTEDNDLSNNTKYQAFSDMPRAFVVNEIMYNPLLNEPEWLEIRQNNHFPEIDTLTLICDNDSLSFKTDEQEFIILCKSKADSLFIRNKYLLNKINIYFGLGYLSNNGENLILKDKYNNINDYFFYKPEWSTNKGVSIERRSPFIVPEDSNWGHCTDFSSIGYTNTIYMQTESDSAVFSINPIRFSPYRNESIVFTINSKQVIKNAFIKIFNLKGKLVYEYMIASNNINPVQFIWNGYDLNHEKISPGIYPVLFRMNLKDGSQKEFVKKIYCGY